MKQNRERLKEDAAEMKFCFRTGRKHNEETNWVIEIHPQVSEKLLTGKLFISQNACKVQEYIAISRCYKCQGYEHMAKYCRVNYEICAHSTKKSCQEPATRPFQRRNGTIDPYHGGRRRSHEKIETPTGPEGSTRGLRALQRGNNKSCCTGKPGRNA